MFYFPATRIIRYFIHDAETSDFIYRDAARAFLITAAHVRSLVLLSM